MIIYFALLSEIFSIYCILIIINDIFIFFNYCGTIYDAIRISNVLIFNLPDSFWYCYKVLIIFVIIFFTLTMYHNNNSIIPFSMSHLSLFFKHCILVLFNRPLLCSRWSIRIKCNIIMADKYYCRFKWLETVFWILIIFSFILFLWRHGRNRSIIMLTCLICHFNLEYYS